MAGLGAGEAGVRGRPRFVPPPCSAAATGVAGAGSCGDSPGGATPGGASLSAQSCQKAAVCQLFLFAGVGRGSSLAFL